MKAAASVAKSQHAQAPERDFRATAQVVLNIHRDDNGFCVGCYVYFRQLKPFPCEYRSWAARVIVAYPTPVPAPARPPGQAECARPATVLRLVPPPASSACDDTAVIRLT